MAHLLADLERVHALITKRGLEPHLGALISESGEQDRAQMLATLENATPAQLLALNQLYRASLIGQAATFRASVWALYVDAVAALEDAAARLRAYAARWR